MRYAKEIAEAFAPDRAIELERAIHELAEREVMCERERCAAIADRCSDDDTRKALGANAAINASQIASAIRATKL